GEERDQLAVELVEHLEDVRLREGRLQVGAVAELRVGLLLVDVVLLGLRRRREMTVRRPRRPHAELEAHSAAAPFAEPLVVGFAVGSTGTSRKLCVRPGPWIRSSLNGFSTDGRLTMNASAVVWRPRVASYAITLM